MPLHMHLPRDMNRALFAKPRGRVPRDHSTFVCSTRPPESTSFGAAIWMQSTKRDVSILVTRAATYQSVTIRTTSNIAGNSIQVKFITDSLPVNRTQIFSTVNTKLLQWTGLWASHFCKITLKIQFNNSFASFLIFQVTAFQYIFADKIRFAFIST